MGAGLVGKELLLSPHGCMARAVPDIRAGSGRVAYLRGTWVWHRGGVNQKASLGIQQAFTWVVVWDGA